MGEIKPFLSSCTFIFDHIFYCAFFIILILVGIDKEENQFGNNLEWFHSFDMKIHKKLQKKSQNLLKVLPKTVLFRNIALIFSLEKPCYLENRVVREPCKRRSACIMKLNLKGFERSKIYFKKSRILIDFWPQARSCCCCSFLNLRA